MSEDDAPDGGFRIESDDGWAEGGEDFNEGRERLLYRLDADGVAFLAAVLSDDGEASFHIGQDGGAEAVPDTNGQLAHLYARMAMELLAASEDIDGGRAARKAVEERREGR